MQPAYFGKKKKKKKKKKKLKVSPCHSFFKTYFNRIV